MNALLADGGRSAGVVAGGCRVIQGTGPIRVAGSAVSSKVVAQTRGTLYVGGAVTSASFGGRACADTVAADSACAVIGNRACTVVDSLPIERTSIGGGGGSTRG